MTRCLVGEHSQHKYCAATPGRQNCSRISHPNSCLAIHSCAQVVYAVSHLDHPVKPSWVNGSIIVSSMSQLYCCEPVCQAYHFADVLSLRLSAHTMCHHSCAWACAMLLGLAPPSSCQVQFPEVLDWLVRTAQPQELSPA